MSKRMRYLTANSTGDLSRCGRPVCMRISHRAMPKTRTQLIQVSPELLETETRASLANGQADLSCLFFFVVAFSWARPHRQAGRISRLNWILSIYVTNGTALAFSHLHSKVCKCIPDDKWLLSLAFSLARTSGAQKGNLRADTH